MPELKADTKRKKIQITLTADEHAMLLNLCHVWNVPMVGTVARKLIVDSLKAKQNAGEIPQSKEQLSS